MLSSNMLLKADRSQLSLAQDFDVKKRQIN